ncbi:MAG: hypothetical protein ACI4X9_06615 [Kiritimatiellia bacterium]
MKFGQMFAVAAGLCAGFSATAATTLTLDKGASDLTLASSSESTLLQRVVFEGFDTVTANGWFFTPTLAIDQTTGKWFFTDAVTYRNQSEEDLADASEVVVGETANHIKLETSGGYVGLNTTESYAVPSVASGQAIEFKVDVAMSVMSDVSSVDVNAIQMSRPKAAVFAVVDTADESQARIAAVVGGKMTSLDATETGMNEFAAGEILYLYDQTNSKFVTIPATGSTNTVAVRVQSLPWGDAYESGMGPEALQLFSVAVDGKADYVWADADGNLKGFAPTSSSDAGLLLAEGSVGSWALSPRFLGTDEECTGANETVEGVLFQGTSDYVANLTLATVDVGGVTPSVHNYTLEVANGTVTDPEGQDVATGTALAASTTYTVAPAAGYIFQSISVLTGIVVDGYTFTTPEAFEEDGVVKVTFKAVSEVVDAGDIGNIPESQLSADAAKTLGAAIGAQGEAFNTWAATQGVKVEDITTASVGSVVNGFLTNLSVAEAETADLLDVLELAFNDDGTVSVIVNGVVSETANLTAAAINGKFVIYSGTSLDALSATDVSADNIAQDGGKITLKVAKPAEDPDAFFYKASITAK